MHTDTDTDADTDTDFFQQRDANGGINFLQTRRKWRNRLPTNTAQMEESTSYKHGANGGINFLPNTAQMEESTSYQTRRLPPSNSAGKT